MSSNAYDAAALTATSRLHWWHVRHVMHEAHLAWLAQQAANAKWAAEHPVRQAPVQQEVAQQPAVTVASSVSVQADAGTYHGSGGVQACIIARESGGNPNVWNASGHYGLYQFSRSTWDGSGGIDADFGHASVAEQNQVFANAVAARGYSDWAPYDGC